MTMTTQPKTVLQEVGIYKLNRPFKDPTTPDCPDVPADSILLCVKKAQSVKTPGYNTCTFLEIRGGLQGKTFSAEVSPNKEARLFEVFDPTTALEEPVKSTTVNASETV